MVASETASSCGPQPNAQPPPPIAQAPNPVLVIITRLEPSGRCGRFIALSSRWSSGRHDGQAVNPPPVYQCSIIALTAVKLELWAGTTHPYWTSIRLGREPEAHYGRRACADLSRY